MKKRIVSLLLCGVMVFSLAGCSGGSSGGGSSDDITLTVNEVPMEGIAISTPSLTINRGESQELKVIFYPENTTDDRNAT